MKIAVNTRFLIPGTLEGIGWVLFEHFSRITRKHKEHTFYFLFDRPFDKKIIFSDNIIPIVIGPPARHPLLWYAWYEIMVPYALRKIKPDVFFSADNFLSLNYSGKQVLMIHDIIAEFLPTQFEFFAAKYLNTYMPRYAEKADRIITVTDTVKQDIVSCYGINPSKITTIYNGTPFVETGTETEYSAAPISGLNETPYFLYVGSLHPRKNIVRIVEAFCLMKKATNAHIKLVLTGRKAWLSEEISHALNESGCQKDIILTGYLEREQIQSLLSGSLALLYPSIMEGFGLPIVEAFKAGVPVITSDVGAMKEVAGSAALLCNAYDTESIAEKMIWVWEDSGLRKTLTTAGKKRAECFVWDSAVEQLWEIIEKEALK